MKSEYRTGGELHVTMNISGSAVALDLADGIFNDYSYR